MLYGDHWSSYVHAIIRGLSLMRKPLKMVLALLDGTPTGMRGQSLVELTITFPIFLIMLVGMAEVGWYANNYLIMTDVVRSAGRAGALGDPNKWLANEERNHERMDCDYTVGVYTRLQSDNPADFTTPKDNVPGAYFGSETDEFTGLGYYDNVACNAIANMAPLEFDDDKDDVIVSVFSYAVVDTAFPKPGTGQPNNGYYGCQFTPNQTDCDDIIIFQRLPDTANNCGSDGLLGYSFRGNYNGTGACPGSQFTDTWMLDQLKKSLVQANGSINPLQLEQVPDYGLVLVEIYWHSQQLLGLPVFQFAGGEIPMHVWSIFPVSAAEPDIEY
jgi:hypothetical protein